ncbi:MAG: YopX family protein [Phycisphaerae bacterium]|jgi:uncharacterized phage protein (TIGR01671 family)
MREIKFRAWFEGQMIEKVGLLWDDLDKETYGFMVTGNAKGCSTWAGLTGADIMQFTGLKDCRGKEIYEKDIVKASWGYGYRGGEDGTVVENLEDIFYWLGESCIAEDIEVIGNIYESNNLGEPECQQE